MLLALVLCVGCAAEANQARAPQSPEQAIEQTLAGLSNVIRSAKLGPQPSDGSFPHGVWLHIEVAADNQMEADWEAALLAGAVADRTAGDGHFLASVIKGYVVDYVPSDGSGEAGGGGTNDVVVAGEKFQPPGALGLAELITLDDDGFLSLDARCLLLAAPVSRSGDASPMMVSA